MEPAGLQLAVAPLDVCDGTERREDLASGPHHGVGLPSFAGAAQGLAVCEVDSRGVVTQGETFDEPKCLLESGSRAMDVADGAEVAAPCVAQAGLCRMVTALGRECFVWSEQIVCGVVTTAEHQRICEHIDPGPPAGFDECGRVSCQLSQRLECADHAGVVGLGLGEMRPGQHLRHADDLVVARERSRLVEVGVR